MMRISQDAWVPRFAAGVTFLLAALIITDAGMGTAQDIDERKLKTHALVTWFDVGAPVGNFTLIRKDTRLCAVRFTEHHRGHDAKPQTIFSSGEESLYAKYECFCRSERGGGFGQATVGEVSKRPAWGIGRFAFGGGKLNLECGPFNLIWRYPARVSFHAEGTQLGDHGIELAPTRWSAISDVNVTDPRLRWFRYDESRSMTYIPSDDL
jgi:hypothetical protein